MHAERKVGSSHNRRIGLCLNERSLAPSVGDALEALGYALSPLGEAPAIVNPESSLWLVDIDRLAELGTPVDWPDARLLVISSERQALVDDPRILAHTRRPGRLGKVYEMIQTALESTPRRCPRIRTKLSARYIRSDRRSIGAVLSLSEGGCLLRTGQALKKGAKVNLQFALPNYGLVSTRAECRYTRRGDAGLAFLDGAQDLKNTIAHFVTLQLATHLPAAGQQDLRTA